MAFINLQIKNAGHGAMITRLKKPRDPISGVQFILSFCDHRNINVVFINSFVNPFLYHAAKSAG
jgi:hypothetical protein